MFPAWQYREIQNIINSNQGFIQKSPVTLPGFYSDNSAFCCDTALFLQASTGKRLIAFMLFAEPILARTRRKKIHAAEPAYRLRPVPSACR